MLQLSPKGLLCTFPELAFFKTKIYLKIKNENLVDEFKAVDDFVLLTIWPVDELTVDEMTVDELTVDELTWYPFL